MMLPRGSKSYFIVLRGPADLVGREKPAFEAFVQSIRADNRISSVL